MFNILKIYFHIKYSGAHKTNLLIINIFSSRGVKITEMTFPLSNNIIRWYIFGFDNKIIHLKWMVKNYFKQYI